MKELEKNELMEVDGGGILDFVRDYIIGKVIDYALPELQEGYAEMYATGYNPFGGTHM
jgi:hypothetical protein